LDIGRSFQPSQNRAVSAFVHPELLEDDLPELANRVVAEGKNTMKLFWNTLNKYQLKRMMQGYKANWWRRMNNFKTLTCKSSQIT